MHIEDLVERLVGYGQYLFLPQIIQGGGWETNFCTSVANQISNGNALTEKQATMALRIIKKYKTELEAAFQKSIDLENPTYRNPFRQITAEKSISVDFNKGIFVRFAYDGEIIKKIQNYVNNADWKSFRWNSVLKNEIASWDHDIKAWVFTLKEENILWLSNNLIPAGFKADETFTNLLADINSTLDNMYDVAPYMVKEDSNFVYKNASNKIPAPNTDNVIQALFEAKNYGITAWNEDVDKELKSRFPSVVTKSFLNTTKALYIDNTVHDISQFEDLVKFTGPVLIIIPGGSEVEHTMAWHQYSRKWGIENGEMSVMFRMPNESHGKFNQYVKEHHLNNEITENTKVVFVSTKIPKPLIKSGLKFNTVINLGYYRDLHFSMSVILNSTTNVCYYTSKQPLGVNVVSS